MVFHLTIKTYFCFYFLNIYFCFFFFFFFFFVYKIIVSTCSSTATLKWLAMYHLNMEATAAIDDVPDKFSDTKQSSKAEKRASSSIMRIKIQSNAYENKCCRKIIWKTFFNFLRFNIFFFFSYISYGNIWSGQFTERKINKRFYFDFCIYVFQTHFTWQLMSFFFFLLSWLF